MRFAPFVAVILLALTGAASAKTYQYDLAATFQGVALADSPLTCVSGTLRSASGCQTPPRDALYFTPGEFFPIAENTPGHLSDEIWRFKAPVEPGAATGSFRFKMASLGGPVTNYNQPNFTSCTGILSWVCDGNTSLDTSTLTIEDFGLNYLLRVDPGAGLLTFSDDDSYVFTAGGVDYNTLGATYEFAISGAQLAVIPLPAGLSLLLTGLVGLGLLARRRTD